MSKARMEEKGRRRMQKIEISTATILRTVGVILAVILLYFIREIVAIVIASVLLAALIDPFADWLERFKFKRGFAVMTVYAVLIAIAASIFFFTAPTIANQSKTLFEKYEPYITRIAGDNPVVRGVLSGEIFDRDIQEIVHAVRQTGIANALPDILSTVTDAFGALVALMLILVLAFYIVVEEKALRNGLIFFIPDKYENLVQSIIPKAKKKIGQWLRGQLLIMLIIFSITYVFLEFILDVPFALILALIAGLLEVVPFIGPMLAVIPALVIGFSVSPAVAFLVGLLYFGLQQLEGEVLTPKIMQKVTGINPVISILAVIIGFELAGPIGAIIAIPLAVVAGVFIVEIHEFNRKSS
jgi:predicted PurR-regulated permease PerM